MSFTIIFITWLKKGKRGTCVRKDNVLVLFDAENMPIQIYYREVEAIVSQEFSQKIWENSKLEAAYKERTEGYTNKGYNVFIKCHYVGYGKDKADDKLVEIAKDNASLNIVIVTNDKALISRIKDISKYQTLVCDAQRIQCYVLDEIYKTALLKKSFEEEIAYFYKVYTDAKKSLKNTNEKLLERKKLLKLLQKENPNIVGYEEKKPFDMYANTMLEGFVDKIEPQYVKTHLQLREQCSSIIEILHELPKVKKYLEEKGLDPSVIKMAIEYTVIDFSKDYFSFDKFIDFIRFFVKGSTLKLVFKEPSIYRIIYIEHTIDGYTELESFDDNDIIETVESLGELFLQTKALSSLDVNFLESLKRKF
jgi:rRNA-processing protein FCF1